MPDHDEHSRRSERRQKRSLRARLLSKLTGEMPPPDAGPSTTFVVADVEVTHTSLDEVPYREAVETLLGGPVESCSARLTKSLVATRFHPFVMALHHAFDGHRPLAISPDHIWLLICQGFAAHVNANAEGLRHRVVSFAGKQRIEVRRHEFVKGAMENPWEEVLPEFVQKIGEHVGPAADLLTPRFSTTGVVETAACQITLMDAMKPYFEYGFASGCGIPSVTLGGTPADWEAVQDRAEAFRPFDLDWWLDPLAEVLDQFRSAAAGQAEARWWRSFYKLNHHSGGPYINGHVLKLLPYLKHWETKEVTVRNEFTATTMEGLPSGLSRAPFRWTVLGPRPRRQYDMEFVGGFVGVRQSERDMSLRPEIGWAVRETAAAQS